ncbi:MAG: hypothetical protein ACTSRP_24195 [Candidatus Helarchaeota archaeon]
MAEEALYRISKKIVSELGPMLTSRPYISIIDKYGKIQYKDDAIDRFSEFISNFVSKNFNFLRVGDHSIPIGGLNMVFFKISPNIVLVVFMKRGLIGQILAFKSKMSKYAEEIEQYIILEPPEGTEVVVEQVQEPEAVVEEKKVEEEEVKVIPQLIKKIRKKDKFPLNDIIVLNLCDGNNTVKEIAEKANVDILTVWNILDEYKRKKYIKITYSGNPEFVPILTKKIPPMAVQLRLMTNLEYQIAKLCDGTRTIEEIEEKLDIDGDKLSELIDRLQRNKIIRMDIKRV